MAESFDILWGKKKNQYYSALKMQIALQGWAESPENSGQRLDSELKSGKMQLSKHNESNWSAIEGVGLQPARENKDPNR